MVETDLLASVLKGITIRAAPFIVTLYGDVVVPRGGVLSTASLINFCAKIGINESLVRTAISRLVAAEQLHGVKVGRRSFYGLTTTASVDFSVAAKLLYAPAPPSSGWQIIHAPQLSDQHVRRLSLGTIESGVYIRPDRGQAAPADARLFIQAVPQDTVGIAQYWKLQDIHEEYCALRDRFLGIEHALQSSFAPSGETALILRLLLVHSYRSILLHDPRLPDDFLPGDWQGTIARTMFTKLYKALSPASDAFIGELFDGPDGLLPSCTTESQARLAGLA